GITINPSAATAANWAGAGGHIQNETGSPLNVTLNGALNAGFALASTSSAPIVFNSTNFSSVRLLNTGSTANMTFNGSYIFSSDLSTNVGSGAFGTLGTGKITLAGRYLFYEGPAATSAKPLTLTGGGGSIDLNAL